MKATYHEVSNDESKERNGGCETLVHSGCPSSHNYDTDGATTDSRQEANWAGYVRVNNKFHFLPLKELPSVLWGLHETFSIWWYL